MFDTGIRQFRMAWGMVWGSRLDPANMDARVLWVSCLLRTGDKAAARAEFAKIERLRPPDLPVLQARFAVEWRSR